MKAHRARAAALAGAMLLSFGAATTTAAADEPKADQAKRDAARALFGQGVKLTESGDNAGALAAFRSAYDKSPSFRVLYNIGQLCARLSDPVCAVRAYDQYLSDGGSDIPGKRRTEVEGELQKLRKLVATVVISVNVAGAEIAVDEAVSGKAPLPSAMILSAGSHKIVATLESKSVDRTIKVGAGESLAVDLEMPSEPPPPQTTPPPAHPAEPDAARAKQATRTDGHGFPIVPWAVTGGLLAATTVTGIFAATSYSSFTAKRASYPVTRAALDDAQSSARTLFLVTGAFGALTIAALGVSGYFTFIKPVGGGPRVRLGAAPRPPVARVALGLTPGGAALVGELPVIRGSRSPRRALVRAYLRVGLGLVAATAAIAAVSCAELFEDPIQCKSNGECAHFNALCDIASGVCVPPSSTTPSAASTGPVSTTREGGRAPPDAQVIPVDKCASSGKPAASIGTRITGGGAGQEAEVAASLTLGCETNWVLDARVFVRPGATLTIGPGTTIHAKKGVGAGLVVTNGARLVTSGRSDAPVVFTSSEASPAAGDWDGVYVLGTAGPAAPTTYNGDDELVFGGSKITDNSGSLTFLRIEYAKDGLVMAGVGKDTVVDSVQVRKTVADCFHFSGGAVDVKHLVCQSPGDDQFEWELEFSGRAQFLFGTKSPATPLFQANGLLIDGSHPVIYNATICGDSPIPPGDGVVFRDEATLDLNNAIVMGWGAGVDATGSVPNPGAVRRSIFFGNPQNPAYVEDPLEANPSSPKFDDDDGFDEIGWFGIAGRLNTVSDPNLPACFDANAPRPAPAVTIATNAASPPADGFYDANANYVGAFKDATDKWMTGAWVRFSDQ